MESNWIANVTLAGWEGVAFHIGGGQYLRWNKLAKLITPIPGPAGPWMSVGSFGSGFQHLGVLTLADMLTWKGQTPIQGVINPNIPFPYGFAVEPDHT